MKEAVRILKTNGLLLVKCQDEIESGRQHWSHIELLEIARKLGMDGTGFVRLGPALQFVLPKVGPEARPQESQLFVGV